jgi:hypothetical protein
MNEGTPETQAKDKMRRLANVVGFLERDIETDLSKNPTEVWTLKELLEKNLWRNRISHYDYHWDFDSNIKDEAEANPGRYTQEEVFNADTERGVKVIRYYHGLLKSFWDEFKEEMLRYSREESFLKVKVPENNFQINCINNRGSFSFFTSAVDAVPQFISLLAGAPADAFKRCKNPLCGKYFVLTSRHKRDFCARLCAATNVQRITREKDPEKFKEYHRRYYHENLKNK